MGVEISGFLEVSNLDEEDLLGEYAWMGCVNIGTLMLPFDDICTILFGHTKWGDSESWRPAAKDRGIPQGVSSLCAQALKELEAWRVNYPNEPVWGFTYITYDEIEAIDWEAYPQADLWGLNEYYGWRTLFEIMKTLSGRFQNQRLIVWFVW